MLIFELPILPRISVIGIGGRPNILNQPHMRPKRANPKRVKHFMQDHIIPARCSIDSILVIEVLRIRDIKGHLP